VGEEEVFSGAAVVVPTAATVVGDAKTGRENEKVESMGYLVGTSTQVVVVVVEVALAEDSAEEMGAAYVGGLSKGEGLLEGIGAIDMAGLLEGLALG
jgi:hypothetical protein